MLADQTVEVTVPAGGLRKALIPEYSTDLQTEIPEEPLLVVLYA